MLPEEIPVQLVHYKDKAGTRAETTTLASAMHGRYPEGTALTTYTCEPPRRLALADGDAASVRVVAVDFDVLPKGAPWGTSPEHEAEKWEAVWEAIDNDASLAQWCYLYFTPHGVRTVYALEEPITADETLALQTAMVGRGFHVGADRKCLDFQRLFFLPHARGEFSPNVQSREVFLDPAQAIAGAPDIPPSGPAKKHRRKGGTLPNPQPEDITKVCEDALALCWHTWAPTGPKDATERGAKLLKSLAKCRVWKEVEDGLYGPVPEHAEGGRDDAVVRIAGSLSRWLHLEATPEEILGLVLPWINRIDRTGDGEDSDHFADKAWWKIREFHAEDLEASREKFAGALSDLDSYQIEDETPPPTLPKTTAPEVVEAWGRMSLEDRARAMNPDVVATMASMPDSSVPLVFPDGEGGAHAFAIYEGSGLSYMVWTMEGTLRPVAARADVELHYESIPEWMALRCGKAYIDTKTGEFKRLGSASTIIHQTRKDEPEILPFRSDGAPESRVWIPTMGAKGFHIRQNKTPLNPGLDPRFDPDAEKFLDLLAGDDGLAKAAFAEYLGRILTPDRDDRALIIQGPKKTGKTAFLAAVTQLFSIDSIGPRAVGMLSDMNTQFNKSIGDCFVISGDEQLPRTPTEREAFRRNLRSTVRSNCLRVEGKGKDSFTLYEPRFKVIATCNSIEDVAGLFHVPKGYNLSEEDYDASLSRVTAISCQGTAAEIYEVLEPLDSEFFGTLQQPGRLANHLLWVARNGTKGNQSLEQYQHGPMLDPRMPTVAHHTLSEFLVAFYRICLDRQDLTEGYQVRVPKLAYLGRNPGIPPTSGNLSALVLLSDAGGRGRHGTGNQERSLTEMFCALFPKLSDTKREEFFSLNEIYRRDPSGSDLKTTVGQCVRSMKNLDILRITTKSGRVWGMYASDMEGGQPWAPRKLSVCRIHTEAAAQYLDESGMGRAIRVPNPPTPGAPKTIETETTDPFPQTF